MFLNPGELRSGFHTLKLYNFKIFKAELTAAALLISVSFGVNELRGKNWINFLGERGARVELSVCIPPSTTTNLCQDIHSDPLRCNNKPPLSTV